MKIAVTGATGFIGRHVTAELERRGIHPILASRRVPLKDPSGRRWVQMDLAAPPENPRHLLGDPDCVIHLAWGGLPNYRSLHHFEEELPRQYRFLKALLSDGLAKVVVTGTCLEYGMQSGRLAEGLATAPTTPYGFAKDILRKQLLFLQRELPFSLAWGRMFYLFGEGQSPQSIYSSFHRALDAGDAAFNMSGGEQLRDFLFVGDAARLLVDLAVSSINPGVVNVCSGNPVSVRSLVERWRAEKTSSISLKLGHYPYPDYEPMAFWGDNRRLHEVLGIQSGESLT